MRIVRTKTNSSTTLQTPSLHTRPQISAWAWRGAGRGTEWERERARGGERKGKAECGVCDLGLGVIDAGDIVKCEGRVERHLVALLPYIAPGAALVFVEQPEACAPAPRFRVSFAILRSSA